MKKDEIIEVLTSIFENTRRIHGHSDNWVKIAIHKSADYLASKLSGKEQTPDLCCGIYEELKEDEERKGIMEKDKIIDAIKIIELRRGNYRELTTTEFIDEIFSELIEPKRDCENCDEPIPCNLECEDNKPEVKTAEDKKYGIWEYFNEQHNLQLLESEVDEVVSLALKDNYVKKEIKTAGEIKHKINQIICRYHQDNDYKTDKATEDLFELINVSQFQEQPITVTDEDEKAITEFDLTDLFDDLEKNAYNAEYHNYNYKQANQIIRKHFEALSLKAQKPSDEDIWKQKKIC